MQAKFESGGTVEFLDPLTGEILDEWKEGCLEIELAQEEIDQQPDREWLPDHFMKRLLTIEAEREVLRLQFKKRMKKLDGKERSLRWHKEARVELVVRKEITGTKNKSVEYEYGTAGLKQNPTRTEVRDGEAALAWAEEHCKEAVKVVPERRSLLKSFLPKTADVPGVERVRPDPEFFIRFPKVKA